ncbi:MAG: hypothetical protein U0228_38595 [Myxococcaceae bacterium]
MTSVSKSKSTNAASQPHGFRMPTHDELVKVYGNIARQAEKAGTAKHLSKAPTGWQKAPAYNITQKGLLGVGKTAYVIKGEIYVKTQVVSPTAKPSWEKIGPAPLF